MNLGYTLIVLLFPLAALAIDAAVLARFEKQCETGAGLSFLGIEQRWSAKAPEQSLEDLQKWVDDAKGAIRSPRDLLASFRNAEKNGAPKDSWPTENFLMGGSRSTQKEAVDWDNPRGLVYGNGLVLAMTDHPKAKDSKAIAAINPRVEIAQCTAGKDCRFAELDFSKAPPKVIPSKECTECHGNPPRLLWQPGPFWDLLTRTSETQTVDRKGSIYEVMKNQSVDLWRDALNFTAYVDRITLKRTASALRDSSDFAQYRYAALAAIMGCADIPAFLGPAKASHEKMWPAGLDNLTSETTKALEAQHESDYRFAQKRLPHLVKTASLQATTSFHDAGRIAALRYLFEKRGVPFPDLSSNFAPGGRKGLAIAGSGTVSELGTIELLCHLLPDMVRPGTKGADARLDRLVEARAGEARPSDATAEECDVLRKLSTRALTPGKPRGGANGTHVPVPRP